MTIIDTTLYANGALRLSRHGAGRGGNVLMLGDGTEQCDISDEGAEHLSEVVANFERVGLGPQRVLHHMESWYPRQTRTSAY